MTFAQRAGIAIATLAVLSLAVAGVWLLRTFDPNAPGNPFPACMFKALTGLYCAGCGATRALHALLHGDVRAAFSMNPLLVLVLPVLPVLTAWSLGWRPVRLQPAMRWLLAPKLWLALLLGFWVLRNLPWPPFSWLAPG
ncbi:DUF2752 domain-containing protein [Pseudoxanthomonas putridarboris]|uniref:DUF2752 domain-containing protein n=2 Tax=Pseudoxanthomonas putridarboris TaxID=752605 RepID=A0ABU9J551_9GAMM